MLGNGQVGRALGTRDGVVVVGRDGVDLRDGAALARWTEAVDAEVVVNAAAWTGVDAAEAHVDEVMAVNAQAPGRLASGLAARGIPLVHLSSAYVFGGRAGPYSEEAVRRPVNVYGRSKAAGEDAVRSANGAHAVVRTCWVFGEGRNLVRTLSGLTGTRKVVDDQLAGPTGAEGLAEALLEVAAGLVARPRQATVHLTGGPDVTYAGFARAIVEERGLDLVIEPVPSTAFPTPAVRPADVRLAVGPDTRSFRLGRLDWRADLRRMP